MKWLLLSLLTLLTSCASVKRDRQVINDFLEVQLAGKQYDTIFVAEKPILREGVWAMCQNYNTNKYASYTFSNEAIRKNISLKEAFDSLQIGALEKQVKNETNWTKKDFTIAVEIAQGKLNTDKFIRPHLSTENHVLFLSKPVFTKDKKYALFVMNVRSVLIASTSNLINSKGIILMQIKNGKWIYLGVIEDENMIE